jgi:hypothetical protein
MDSEDFRRARDVAAWILLAAAVAFVVIGAWELFGLPSAPFPGSSFRLRSDSAVGYLTSFEVTLLPVAAVLLVTFVGRPAATAWQLTRAAVVVAWAASLGGGGLDSGWYSLSRAAELAVAAAGLIFTAAVLRWRVLIGTGQGRKSPRIFPSSRSSRWPLSRIPLDATQDTRV